MARVYISSVITAPAAKVWARVRDFNGLPSWHPAIAREPDRERRAGRQGRLHPRLPPAQRRPHPRAAARAVGLRHVLHLLDPRIADGRRELRRDAAADADHRRRAHLLEWTAEFDCAPERETELVADHRHAACSRAASTHSSASSEDERHAARRPQHDHRRARRPRMGDAARLQRSRPLAPGREDQRDRAPPPPTRSAACAASAAGRVRTARAIAHAVRPRKTFSYCLLDTPVPLFNYVAHVRLMPVTDGNRTFWQLGEFVSRPGGRRPRR